MAGEETETDRDRERGNNSHAHGSRCRRAVSLHAVRLAVVSGAGDLPAAGGEEGGGGEDRRTALYPVSCSRGRVRAFDDRARAVYSFALCGLFLKDARARTDAHRAQFKREQLQRK